MDTSGNYPKHRAPEQEPVPTPQVEQSFSSDPTVAFRVEGYCPMCGRAALIKMGSRLMCTDDRCPNPLGLHILLQNRMISDHLVRVGEDGFSVQHPMRERLNGELFVCGLHVGLSQAEEAPVEPGLYVATLVNDAWDLTRVTTENDAEPSSE